MELGTINLITVPVTDQDRAKKFYVETLGFEEKFDYVMSGRSSEPDPGDDTRGTCAGSRWVMLTPPHGGPDITLANWSGDRTPPGSARLSITCDDVDTAWERLRRLGVPVDGISDAPWGRWFGFDDPDGNHWQVVQEP
ncbi:MAG TPA: VOC family protein [Micromonospora sp.]